MVTQYVMAAGAVCFQIMFIHFFGLSIFYDFQAGLLPYLCHLPICDICVICIASLSVSSVFPPYVFVSSVSRPHLCVSHCVCHIMCVTFVSLSVGHMHQI